MLSPVMGESPAPCPGWVIIRRRYCGCSLTLTYRSYDRACILVFAEGDFHLVKHAAATDDPVIGYPLAKLLSPADSTLP